MSLHPVFCAAFGRSPDVTRYAGQAVWVAEAGALRVERREYAPRWRITDGELDVCGASALSVLALWARACDAGDAGREHVLSEYERAICAGRGAA